METKVQEEVKNRILESIDDRAFIKLIQSQSWLSKYDAERDLTGYQVGGHIELLGKFSMDSSEAPVYKMVYTVFQITNIQYSKNGKYNNFLDRQMRAVGVVNELILKYVPEYDKESGKQIDKFELVKIDLDPSAIKMHAR